MLAREQAGEETSLSAAIIDSQSVKTREFGGIKGFEAGTKVMGRKRHLLTDSLSLPLIITVHSAGIQARDGFMLVIDTVRKRLPWLRIIVADGDYNAIQTESATA